MLDNADLGDLLAKKWSARIARACAIALAAATMPTCGIGFVRWRASAGGSAIAGCIFCFDARAGRSTGRRKQVGHMAAPSSTAKLTNTLASGEPSTQGRFRTSE